MGWATRYEGRFDGRLHTCRYLIKKKKRSIHGLKNDIDNNWTNNV
jgi:hypothetical protein